MSKLTSQRGSQWQAFAAEVAGHIEHYTVPQYGDFPNDQLTGLSDESILDNIRRYLNRFASRSRHHEGPLDMLKVAHYACELHRRLTERKAAMVETCSFCGQVVPERKSHDKNRC